MRIAAQLFVAILCAIPFADSYAARFPAYVALPDLPLDKNAVEAIEKAESEFILREKTELLRGRAWLGYLDYRAQWGDNKRDVLAGIVREMEQGGWEVLLRDEPRVPPLATLKFTTKDNKEVFATVEVFDKARVLVLEPAAR
jgi:hypothetical protein